MPDSREPAEQLESPERVEPVERADSPRVHSVDGLRAIAFLAVFAFHTWEFAGRPSIPVVSYVVGQNIRPDFFVVLTGFVLYLPFGRDESRLARFDTRGYLRRRLRRIVVPYYAALAFAVLLPQTLVVLTRLLGRESSWQPMPGIGDWVSHLTFSHLFFQDWWSSINGSLWTMSLEMQLYLLFPLLLVAMSRWGLRALVAALVVSVLFRACVSLVVVGPAFPDEIPWAASGLGRLMEFVAGMVVADLVFRRRWRPALRVKLALVVGMAMLFGLASSGAASGLLVPVRELALACLFGSLIGLTMTSQSAARLFAWRPLSFIGFRAYSLFLVHQPLVWYVSEALKKFGGIEDGVALLLLLWTVGLGVVLAVGEVFFRAVEQPCIAWAKRVPVTAPAAGPRRGGPAARIDGAAVPGPAQ